MNDEVTGLKNVCSLLETLTKINYRPLQLIKLVLDSNDLTDEERIVLIRGAILQFDFEEGEFTERIKDADLENKTKIGTVM